MMWKSFHYMPAPISVFGVARQKAGRGGDNNQSK
jgi:hypothetical protein